MKNRVWNTAAGRGGVRYLSIKSYPHSVIGSLTYISENILERTPFLAASVEEQYAYQIAIAQPMTHAR
jgi:hypothetical protein